MGGNNPETQELANRLTQQISRAGSLSATDVRGVTQKMVVGGRRRKYRTRRKKTNSRRKKHNKRISKRKYYK